MKNQAITPELPTAFHRLAQHVVSQDDLTRRNLFVERLMILFVHLGRETQMVNFSFPFLCFSLFIIIIYL